MNRSPFKSTKLDWFFWAILHSKPKPNETELVQNPLLLQVFRNPCHQQSTSYGLQEGELKTYSCSDKPYLPWIGFSFQVCSISLKVCVLLYMQFDLTLPNLPHVVLIHEPVSFLTGFHVCSKAATNTSCSCL